MVVVKDNKDNQKKWHIPTDQNKSRLIVKYTSFCGLQIRAVRQLIVTKEMPQMTLVCKNCLRCLHK